MNRDEIDKRLAEARDRAVRLTEAQAARVLMSAATPAPPPSGRGAAFDVMASMAAMASAIDIRVDPHLPPGSILLVSRDVFSDLRAMERVRFDDPFDVAHPAPWEPIPWRDLGPFRPSGLAFGYSVGTTDYFEFRLGPYTPPSGRAWCVVRNLTSGRREVRDWPLPADVLVGIGPGPDGRRPWETAPPP